MTMKQCSIASAVSIRSPHQLLAAQDREDLVSFVMIMSDSEDTIEISSSEPDECASSDEEDGANLFDLLSDEIMLEIIHRCDFWSRENLRATCLRMKRMIDGEVKKLVIDKEWVTKTFSGKRFVHLRSHSKKSKHYLPPEVRHLMQEGMITDYITRHPMLKTLFLNNCGMTLLHNSKGFQEDFTLRLASKCTNIEEMLVCGSTGMRILLSYLNFIDREPALKVLRLNPYQASGILATYLIQAMQKCPHLKKIVLFATEYEGTTSTYLMKHEEKMTKFLTACNKHQLKSLVTCFRTEHSFKTAAIDKLSDMAELVFSGPFGTANEYVSTDFPMTGSNVSKICERNPSLRTLKVFLDHDACIHLSKLQSVEKLILVLQSPDRSACEHVFSTSRPRLSVLGLTFLARSPCPIIPCFNLSNCPNLNVFAVTFNDQTSVTAVQVLNVVSASLKELRELYYTGIGTEGLLGPEGAQSLTRIFVSCRSLRKIQLNNSLFVRGEDGMQFKCDLPCSSDPREAMERELFC